MREYEVLIEEMLFAKTVQRFDDHIRVQNLEEAVFDKGIAQRIVDLHGEISKKASMHNRSNFQIRRSELYQDFIELRNKFEKLYKDLKDKKRENLKKKIIDKTGNCFITEISLKFLCHLNKSKIFTFLLSFLTLWA